MVSVSIYLILLVEYDFFHPVYSVSLKLEVMFTEVSQIEKACADQRTGERRFYWRHQQPLHPSQFLRG